MLKIDRWYPFSLYDVDRVDVFFYPESGQYRGNLYIGGRAVGDYYSDNSVEVEQKFQRIFSKEVKS